MNSKYIFYFFIFIISGTIDTKVAVYDMTCESKELKRSTQTITTRAKSKDAGSTSPLYVKALKPQKDAVLKPPKSNSRDFLKPK